MHTQHSSTLVAAVAGHAEEEGMLNQSKMMGLYGGLHYVLQWGIVRGERHPPTAASLQPWAQMRWSS